MAIWYKIHKWTSIVCAVFLLLLILTGIPLLFRDQINAWNTINLPPQSAPMPQNEIWTHLAEGIQAFRKNYPQKQILAATPDPDNGTLYFLAKNRDDKKMPVAHMRMGGEQVVYDVRTGVLFDRTNREYKYPQVAAFLHDMHILHTNMGLGQGGKLFLGFMCLLSVVAIISGYFLYKPFMKGLPFGVLRAGGRPFVSDMHKSVSILAAVFAGVLALSGVFIVLYSFGNNAYRQNAAVLARTTDNTSGRFVSPSAAIAKIRDTYPDKNILSMHLPRHRGGHYTFDLADAGAKRDSFALSEMVFLPAHGENNPVLAPAPAYLHSAPIFLNLHIHNHDSLVLRALWAILLLFSAFMIITGIMLWLRKFPRIPAAKAATGQTTKQVTGQYSVWRMPILLGVLGLMGLVLPLWSGVTELLGTLVLIALLVLFIRLSIQNRR